MNKKLFYVFNTLSVLALFLLALPSSVSAQYFGQNKVNYDDFEFKVLKTKHFDIYFYDEEKDAAYYAARMSERWYARHVELTGDTLKGRQAVIMYASFPQFIQTNVLGGGQIGQGTGGVTEPYLRRVVLPFAGPLAETDHVLGHELIHAFQFDLTGSSKGQYTGNPTASYMPLWFIEGMAEYFSIGPVDPFTSMWMRDAAEHGLPDISDLTNPKYFPYRFGQALLSYIGGTYGNQKIVQILRIASKSKNLNFAIDTVLSIKVDSLSKQWHASLHKLYDSLKAVTDSAAQYGPLLVSSKDFGEDLNISPVLSPDGKQMAFFSSRNLFSIDIFLADAETGKIKRTILSTALDPHLQTMGFINSAGAWSPDGKKFIFSTSTDARPVLSILDIKSGNVEKEIRFPKLGEIYSPSWSPDGKQVVFSAIANGFTDLYLYDFGTGETKKLTDDPYADLQPEWSPDGKEIAFATDRFTTDLDDIKEGNYTLAEIDPITGKIKSLPSFNTGKNINPQWSPDGKSIYFISNHDGISNIYKAVIATNKISQLTSLYTGVSGITSISPAISVAAKANKIVYSAFENSKYSIYALDSTKYLENKPSDIPFSAATIDMLPPVDRFSSTFVDNLKNPDLGLPSDTSHFQIADYDASFHLIGAAQGVVGAGTDRYGSYLGGGVGLYWSDLLGNHNLLTALQLQVGGDYSYIGGVVNYVNTAHRLGWGGTLAQVPYYYGGYNAGYGTVNGEPAYIEEDYIFKQTTRQVSGLISYPFSPTFRTDLSAGFMNISFSNKVHKRAYSLNTGIQIQDEVTDLGAQNDINLGTLSAALVYDNSVFGATSPILGSRARLEVSPAVGSLLWFNVLADMRYYLMPIRPFTIAARVLHLGRYGKDAEDQRLFPYYLGYPDLVRGYSQGSFSNAEYYQDPNSYNELYGSKLAVANLELRFPLLGLFGIGQGYYGFLPIETAFFYDAGIAWNNGDKIGFSGTGKRTPISSYGAAIRMNLFGYAVGEVDYVYPVSRPQGWMWQFNLIEGF